MKKKGKIKSINIIVIIIIIPAELSCNRSNWPRIPDPEHEGSINIYSTSEYVGSKGFTSKNDP